MYVTNLQGNTAEFRYEFFPKNDANCNFVLAGDYCPNPTFWLFPQEYKMKNPPLGNYGGNYDEGISIGGWGQIPYSTDAYKAWLAQSCSSLVTGTLTSAVRGGVMGGWAGALAGAASSAASSGLQIGVQDIIQSDFSTAAMPPQSHGSYSPMSQLALGILDFWFIPKHITAEFAKIIDDYFTRFGYACHKLKVPNRSSRPQFNYVKTVGCLIEAAGMVNNNIGLPADDEEAIKKIYDNGITFWKNPANIGNYSVNNAPVST